MKLETSFLVVFLVFLSQFECSLTTMSLRYGAGEDAMLWYDGEWANNMTDQILPWKDITYREKVEQPIGRKLTDEERLTRILFHQYASSLRPVFNSSHTVYVQFGLNLIQIGDMDEINQVLELSVWMEMTWMDERLRWNPKEFSNLRMIRLPTRLLWIPDIVLYNSADDFDRRTSAEDVRAMIGYSGEIFLGPYVKLRSTCILDLTLYPYDEQNCTLVFGSWTYDKSQLMLETNAKFVELAQYKESAKWELLQSSVYPQERHHSCCESSFSDIIITIKMRRRFLFTNLFNIFIPTVWLSLLCLLCFYLAPESGEKITLGITVLLTFTLFTWMVAENTPRTSDFVPLLSIYLTATMSLSALVVGLQVFMLNVHGLTPVLRPAPKVLRFVVIDILAKCLRINPHVDNRGKRKLFQKFDRLGLRDKSRLLTLRGLKQQIVRLVAQGDCCGSSTDMLSASSSWPAEDFADEAIDQQFNAILEELNSTPRLRFLAREAHFLSTTDVSIGQKEMLISPLLTGRKSRRKRCYKNQPTLDFEEAVLKRLIHAVAYMSEHETSEELISEVANEWRLIAIVFDRLAFWFFFIFTLSITFGLLVLIPITQKKYPDPKSAAHVTLDHGNDTQHILHH